MLVSGGAFELLDAGTKYYNITLGTDGEYTKPFELKLSSSGKMELIWTKLVYFQPRDGPGTFIPQDRTVWSVTPATADGGGVKQLIIQVGCAASSGLLDTAKAV